MDKAAHAVSEGPSHQISFDVAGWVILSFIVLVVAWLIWDSLDHGRPPEKFFRAKPILTDNEIEFFKRLSGALPGYVLLSQVSMSALLQPAERFHGAEYMRLRARFAQKFVDFVVCDPVTIEVIAIIELDDITHDPEKDARRDEMLADAGYTVIRWHSRRKPTQEQILDKVRSVHFGKKKRKRS